MLAVSSLTLFLTLRIDQASSIGSSYCGGTAGFGWCNKLVEFQACSFHKGCTWLGYNCAPKVCAGQQDRALCERMGCQWTEYGLALGLCSGVAGNGECESYADSSTCVFHAGCFWRGGYSCGPVSCVLIGQDQALCASMGCQWFEEQDGAVASDSERSSDNATSSDNKKEDVERQDIVDTGIPTRNRLALAHVYINGLPILATTLAVSVMLIALYRYHHRRHYQYIEHF